MKETCPTCDREGTKVMYMCIPMRLCVPHKEVFGPLSWFMEYLPFDGCFVRYDGYWSAVWDVMRGKVNE